MIFQSAILLCLAVTALSQSSDTGEIIQELICSDDQCSEADNATKSYFSSYLNCIIEYNHEYGFRRCNFTVNNRNYPACALKEDGVFCSEVLNQDIQIPSACDSITICSEDCKTALLAKFGCCIEFNFIQLFETSPSYFRRGNQLQSLVRLSELCAVEVSEPCQSIIPPLPDTIPTQTSLCPTDNIFIGIGRFLYEGMCERYVQHTQTFVNEAIESTCFNSKLLGLHPFIYCENSEVLGYCQNIRDPAFTSPTSDIRTHCNVLNNCTSICREALERSKQMFGCCANAMVFRSDPLTDRSYSCQDDVDIWSHCDVPRPDFCSNTILLNSHGSTIDIKLSFVFLAAVIVTLWTF